MKERRRRGEKKNIGGTRVLFKPVDPTSLLGSRRTKRCALGQSLQEKICHQDRKNGVRKPVAELANKTENTKSYVEGAKGRGDQEYP